MNMLGLEALYEPACCECGVLVVLGLECSELGGVREYLVLCLAHLSKTNLNGPTPHLVVIGIKLICELGL